VQTIVQKTEGKETASIYPACEPKPPSSAPSQFNKAREKHFIRLESYFLKTETKIFFWEPENQIFLLENRKFHVWKI